MPIVVALDLIAGASQIDAVTPTVGSYTPDYTYRGLDEVDGSSAVQAIVRSRVLSVLDVVEASTVVSLRVVPDLGDAPPISMGFYARCHALLLPPVTGGF